MLLTLLLQLGENGTSWGYGGTAKKSHDNNYVGYGEKYGLGDSIICYIDLDSKVGSLRDCHAYASRENSILQSLQRDIFLSNQISPIYRAPIYR